MANAECNTKGDKIASMQNEFEQISYLFSDSGSKKIKIQYHEIFVQSDPA